MTTERATEHSLTRHRWRGIVLRCFNLLALLSGTLAVIQILMVPPTVRILVMGMEDSVSKGKPIYEGFPGQKSDAMMVVELNRIRNTTTVWQVPRDTLAYVSDELGWEKANTSISVVGAKKTRDVVASIMGRKIHHYMVLTIPDFQELYDILHGTHASAASANEPEFLTGKSKNKIPRNPKVSSEANKALLLVQGRPGSDADRRQEQQVFVAGFLSTRPHVSLSTVPRLVMWAHGVDMSFSLLQAAQFGFAIMMSKHEFRTTESAEAYLNTFSYVLPADTIGRRSSEKR